MRLALPVLVLWLLPCTRGLSQQPAAGQADSAALVPTDSTQTWHYPYQVTPERRERIRVVVEACHDSCSVPELVRELGAPARSEVLSWRSSPLSAFDAGLLAGARGHRVYRLVWYVKKLTRAPSVTDSYIAAYVRSDGRTVLTVRTYGLN
jgi:hypothetical protein